LEDQLLQRLQQIAGPKAAFVGQAYAGAGVFGQAGLMPLVY